MSINILVGNYVYKYIDDVFVKLKDAFIGTTTANDLSLLPLSLSLPLWIIMWLRNFGAEQGTEAL